MFGIFTEAFSADSGTSIEVLRRAALSMSICACGETASPEIIERMRAHHDTVISNLADHLAARN